MQLESWELLRRILFKGERVRREQKVLKRDIRTVSLDRNAIVKEAGKGRDVRGIQIW